MSLFEDLIDELKEDNLLEETVIESNHSNDKKAVKAELQVVTKPKVSDASVKNDNVAKPQKVEPTKSKKDPVEVEQLPLILDSNEDEAIVIESENILVEEEDIEKVSDVVEKVAKAKTTEEHIQKETVVIEQEELVKEAVSDSNKKEVDEKEFYRRRALDEVNGLEMVDHVLSGVEREMMKTIPKAFDSSEVKQALHEFLQIAEDIKSPKHAELEFGLMKETEIWYSALAERDKEISVSNLRRYCETTKPSLSSQALMSLARFYRNSPYSETIRSKFDLVVTKLFSNDTEGGKRELVFDTQDLVQHIQELYADWSSTPLYSVDEDDSELLLAALKFQDFITEAESAENFDELVKKDFFRRLKVFKEKTNENFFAPMLVAAAVESNVAVGNTFVNLIYKERDEEQEGSLDDKYGIIHDKAISEATSKSLELVGVLEEVKEKRREIAELEKLKAANTNNAKGRSNGKKGAFSTSKWLIAATIITVIIGAVFFITTGTNAPKEMVSDEINRNVKVVNLENSSLKEYVESAKISDQTMFAITNESWDKRAFEDKEKIVGKFVRTGEEKGFIKVHLINSKGETVAFGSKEGVNIIQ